ncbi:hypothetical protein [Mesorhizobium sp. M0213]|uniref:hypothetical protein n=1 Tax=Mesorhizobium sp. M0213 TaxID=2956917 RepID=UPI00333A6CAE
MTALGWYLGGLRMAAFIMMGAGLRALFGYWVASMNTLSLVLVSVPFAQLLIGLAQAVMPYTWGSRTPPMSFALLAAARILA